MIRKTTEEKLKPVHIDNTKDFKEMKWNLKAESNYIDDILNIKQAI